MMWNRLLPFLLPLLHGVVEKEIDQDGIDFCLWMVSLDLASNELNAPDTAT